MSSLFDYLSELQGDLPWGRVLDAGTGWGSLGWLSGLETESLTAVTGDPGWRDQLSREFSLRHQDRIVCGNWVDPDFLEGEQFDTVLVDYLVGAVDRFAPYFQRRLLERLKTLVRGRLYLVGLEPYPAAGSDRHGRLVEAVANLRDATLLLAGDRPHREYPAWWVLECLKGLGFQIFASRAFPIRYRRRFVEGELGVVRRHLARVDSALAKALAEREKAVRREALATIERDGSLRWGTDYVVACSVGIA